MADRTVAKTIAQQIGHRAFFMMGTKNRLADDRSLSFDIKGCKRFNYIKITLDPTDTYIVEFIKTRKHQIQTTVKFDMVYFDELHDLITTQTGLALSL